MPSTKKAENQPPDKLWLLEKNDVRSLTKLSFSTIDEMINEGKLCTVSIKNRTYFHPEQVRAVILDIFKSQNPNFSEFLNKDDELLTIKKTVCRG